MTRQPITIHTPDGFARPVERGGVESAPGNLAAWMEDHGFPLNTRCGGRGVCKGCRVNLDGREVRACQTSMDSLPNCPVTIHIPQLSWRDRTLKGVSEFELRTRIPNRPLRGGGIGLALDIGTTTVAGSLWNLGTGAYLATAACGNAQRRYGDNVLSRISYSLDHPDGLERLHMALVEDSIQPLLRELCAVAGVQPVVIVRANAAGNPTMLHTLARQSLEGLSRYPFKPAFLDTYFLKPGDTATGLLCPLQLLPALGPFVGSDITAGALAAGLLDREGPALLIDFGTNGEILLKTRDGFLATATAAGPAFEGGRLNCGATAGPGVVASFACENGLWSHTLCESGGEACAISGAAYVDFLALAREAGLLNSFGRLDRSRSGVSQRVIDGRADYCITLGESLFVSEADIAELIQAKAAIAGGVATLLELADLEADDLETVFVAGGFGYHLHPAHARAIGLLPNVPLERLDIIGNSSLGGASLLLQQDDNTLLRRLTDACTIVELNLVSAFEDHYTDAMTLDPLE